MHKYFNAPALPTKARTKQIALRRSLLEIPRTCPTARRFAACSFTACSTQRPRNSHWKSLQQFLGVPTAVFRRPRNSHWKSLQQPYSVPPAALPLATHCLAACAPSVLPHAYSSLAACASTALPHVARRLATRAPTAWPLALTALPLADSVLTACLQQSCSVPTRMGKVLFFIFEIYLLPQRSLRLLSKF